MESEQLAELQQRVAEFDDLIFQAKRQIYAGYGSDTVENMLQHDLLISWKLSDFLNDYSTADVYPIERLPGVVDRLIDTKLQLYYATQVFPGSMNLMVYARGFDPKNPLATSPCASGLAFIRG